MQRQLLEKVNAERPLIPVEGLPGIFVKDLPYSQVKGVLTLKEAEAEAEYSLRLADWMFKNVVVTDSGEPLLDEEDEIEDLDAYLSSADMEKITAEVRNVLMPKKTSA